MEEQMPRSKSLTPSSTVKPLVKNSQIKKFSYSVFIAAVSAAYSAIGPTLVGGLLGKRIFSEEISYNDMLFDMEISAASMAVFGMLSYPYQNIPGYTSLRDIVNRNVLMTSLIFITAPLNIPLIVNTMSRKKDFNEFNSLAVGGLFTQLIALILILLAWDYFDVQEDKENDVHHGHHVHLHNSQDSIFQVMRTNTYETARQFRRIFNLNNARLAVHYIKIESMRSILKYLVNAWHAEFRDPYSKYFLTELDKAEEVSEEVWDAHFAHLDKWYEKVNTVWYNEKRFAGMREKCDLVRIQAEAQQHNTFLSIQMQQAAMLQRAEEIRQDILKEPIVREPLVRETQPLDEKKHDLPLIAKESIQNENSQVDEKKHDLPPKNAPHANNRSWGKVTRVIAGHKKKVFLRRAKEEKPKEEKPPLKLSDIRTRSLSNASTPTLTPISTPVPAIPASTPTGTPTLSNICTPNRTAFFQMPAPSMEPIFLDSNIQVVLDSLEKKVFDFLDMLVPEGNHNYKTYIVGGWAYDKVLQAVKGIPFSEFNDIDIVTEIPPQFLSGTFEVCPHVKGLYIGKLLGKQLEIKYEPDLSDLLQDAKKRDFFTFYIDKFAKVWDPTKYELFNLQLGLLYTSRQMDIMFKEDPVMILRGIYKATKKNLNFEAYKDMMIADRMNLFACFMDTTLPPEKIVTPLVMNSRILKLFTQHFALTNVNILFDLGILAALFPTIYSHMVTAKDWIQEEMSKTAKHNWPKLSMIYAIFITPAVVHQLPVYANIVEKSQENIYEPTLLQFVKDIGEFSPLIKAAFTDPNELYDCLRKPLKMYSDHLNAKFQQQVANTITTPTTYTMRM
jgi:tRNA nucleotidyltransferase/poly(A) polymerase